MNETKITKERILPSPPAIEDDEGFEKNDLFGFKTFGQTLCNLFLNAEDLSVVLLDDDWGRGKSTFVKQWAGLMRTKGCNVIYLDAFEKDFLNDPFLALTSAATNNASNEEDKTKFIEAGLGLAQAMSLNLIEKGTGGLIKPEDLKKLLENNASGELEEVKEFKARLTKIAGDGELIFIVDELDRCRPDFALRMLEQIKHFFEVPNVSFLLVAGQKQLAAMVNKAYGYNEEYALKYLDKFCQVKVYLPQQNWFSPDNINIFARYLVENSALNVSGRYTELIELLSFVAKKYSLSLRDLERVWTRFTLTVISGKVNSKGVDEGFYYSFLIFCLLKHIDSEIYDKIKNNEPDIWRATHQALRIAPSIGTLWENNKSENFGIYLRGFLDDSKNITLDKAHPFLRTVFTGNFGLSYGFDKPTEYVQQFVIPRIENIAGFTSS